MSLSNASLELLEVMQWPRVGPARARQFVAAALAEDGSILGAAMRIGPVPPETEQRRAREHREDIIAQCERGNIAIVGLADRVYPTALSKIADPPPILYVRGSVPVLSQRALAVVGTRNVSTSGGRNARTIARFLVQQGFAVVSGLALGIDTHAHSGALEAGGLTIAVLAHGLHTVAPTSNRDLAERILAKGGALVSEHPPGVPPRPAEFVRRNRIQSGLSLGSVIVESGVEGGAMHQAAFTRSQGRALFTVLSASSETRGDLNEAGARLLVDRGDAIPLQGTRDLLRELGRLAVSLRADESGTSTMLF